MINYGMQNKLKSIKNDEQSHTSLKNNSTVVYLFVVKTSWFQVDFKNKTKQLALETIESQGTVLQLFINTTSSCNLLTCVLLITSIFVDGRKNQHVKINVNELWFKFVKFLYLTIFIYYCGFYLKH